MTAVCTPVSIITYKTFVSEKTVANAIKSNRYAHLNESWGVMHKWWKGKGYYGNLIKIKAISIAYCNGIPIGGCILLDGCTDVGCNLGVCVLPYYRGRGIGTKLVRLIKHREETVKFDPCKRLFFTRALST